MTVKIEDGTTQYDWSNILENLGLTLLEGVQGNAPGLVERLKNVIMGANVDPTVDQLAGIWLRATALEAVSMLIKRPEIDARINGAAKQDAAIGFVKAALTLNGYDELDPTVQANPTSLPVVVELTRRVIAFVNQLDPNCELSDAQIEKQFLLAFNTAAHRTIVSDPNFFQRLDAALSTRFGEAERRDRAWARHEEWIKSLYDTKPIFSLPEVGQEDRDIPLHEVYHRLRCFWHEEMPDPGADRAPYSMARSGEKTRRIAHIADLHQTLHAWLGAKGRDHIRVVAGGPGSGKSSFAAAFASEVVQRATHRVIYVQLQTMPLGGELRARIERYLKDRHHTTRAEGGAGFPADPLDYRSGEEMPYLLVFDGLDELTHSDDAAQETSRKFIFSVNNLLTSLNAVGPEIRALILGRSTACQEAMKEADLDLKSLIHVAPLTPIREHRLKDPEGLAKADQREAFWRRSAVARGMAPDPVPEAITAKALNELNAEPLLLHLLILSGYTSEDKWREAAENRNLIYQSIFQRIHERDKNKEHSASQNLQEAEYFTLQECLGLASWRGNGRTGSETEFQELKSLHARHLGEEKLSLPASDLGKVAVQTFARQDISGGEGYEFIHKSFGEYLAARGLLMAGLRCARLLRLEEEPRTVAEVALRWVRLIDQAELTVEVLRFLVDQARILDSDTVESSIAALTEVFNAALKDGLPVNKVWPEANYRELETRQRCAESALLAVLNALNRRRRELSPPLELGEDFRTITIPVNWSDNTHEPRHLLNRLLATTWYPVSRALGCLNLSRAYLSGADMHEAGLSGADLSGAYLIGAHLSEADLSEADLSAADLKGADLSEADLSAADLKGADLSEADLSSADLSGANLSDADLRGAQNLTQEQINPAHGNSRTFLPDHLTLPDHWKKYGRKVR
ncbi:MAG: pentapeptide repeat-containing protein [Pseudomonadota bacterium]